VKLTSGTEGRGTAEGNGELLGGRFEKVVDTGLMTGVWTGEMVALEQERQCTLRIGSDGNVISIVGFEELADGGAYATQSGLAVAYLRTGDPGAFHQIFLHTGSVVDGVWSGTLSVDQTGGDGTFLLERE
jgi:hypothetical protein